MNRYIRAAFVAGVAVMSVAATGNWLATVMETPGGHRMGNPQADVHLVEYVSYTCPHCAHFEQQSEGALKIGGIQPGKVSVEVRHLVRDPVDLTVVILANCGPKERFFQNHTMFMVSQDEWLGKARDATAAQQQRWRTGTLSSRWRAITSDLGLYDKMETRGYSRSDVDACLNDEANARALVERSNADVEKYSLSGTPSFMVDGKLLKEVHSWPALQEALKPHL